MITLEHNGIEQSLAAWGFSLSSPVCSHRNLAVSTYQVFVPGASVSDAPVFGFEEKVIIRRQRSGSGTAWSGGYTAFIGYQTGMQAACSGSAEGVNYLFSNAWYFLENTAYQQAFASRNVSAHEVEFLYMSEVLIFTGLDEAIGLVPRNNGEQIADILGFLNSCFTEQSMAPPMITGTVDPSLALPSYRLGEVMCAAAILKCLELSPDVQCVFDYSTLLAGVPTPTVHFYSHASLTEKSLAVKNGNDHKSLRIIPRYDLQVRSVVMNYRITNTDAVEARTRSWVTRVQDKYGPNGANHASDPERGLRVLSQTIDLQGAATSSVKSKITTQAVEAAHSSNEVRLNWWKEKCQKLKSDRIRDLTINAATVTIKERVNNADRDVSLDSYPNELTKGQIAPWIQLNQKRVTISALASFDLYASRNAAGNDTVPPGTPIDGLLTRQVRNEPIFAQIVLTDGTTGDYSAQATSLSGEAVPVGIAQEVYTSLATLQYEGEDVRVQMEVTNPTNNGSLITLAHKLNLTGGRAAWETMGAQIQQITEHDGFGETSITFGPAKHISAGDLAAMFQFNRLRRWWFNPNLRETASYADNNNEVTLGEDLPRENTNSGDGHLEMDSVSAPVD